MTYAIKVSDLLVSGAKNDRGVYDAIQIVGLSPYLAGGGLSGIINFQPVPLGIVANFRSWSGTFHFVSEYSGSPFIETITIPEYQIIFLKEFSSASDNAYDTEFPIDLQRGEIDIALPIEQMFRLEFPIVFYAPGEREAIVDDGPLE